MGLLRFRAMLMNLKNILKLPWYFIRNLQYNRQTTRVMKMILKPGSNCIDIGCHKGRILDQMLALAPGGTFWAFEPLPMYYDRLSKKYDGENIILSAFALSDQEGEGVFQYVRNAPGYSGFRKRTYHIPFPGIREITVKKKRLDTVIPQDSSIDFIKLDVEGAELEVLRGAVQLLKRTRPFILFEHGIGAAPHYGTAPGDVFDLLTDCSLKVSSLRDWYTNKQPLNREQFTRQFYNEKNYYFLAHP